MITMVANSYFILFIISIEFTCIQLDTVNVLTSLIHKYDHSALTIIIVKTWLYMRSASKLLINHRHSKPATKTLILVIYWCIVTSSTDSKCPKKIRNDRLDAFSSRTTRRSSVWSSKSESRHWVGYSPMKNEVGFYSNGLITCMFRL